MFHINKALIFIISTLIYSNLLFAQTKPTIEQRAFQDSSGVMYWNKNLPVYISLSTSPDAPKFNLKSKKYPQYDNPFYFDTEGENFMRTRWAVDKNTRKSIQPQIEILWEVLADGIAPSSHLKFVKISSIKKNGKAVYGAGTAISLSGTDAVSGIDAFYYSVNGQNYEQYKAPVTFNTAGDYTVKYFASDRVGNVEEDNIISFTIDSEAPSTLCLITGVKLGDENIVSSLSKLHFESTDNYVGVKRIFFTLNDGKEQLYNGKNIPVAHLEDGKYTLKFYAEDNVGNREQMQEYSFYMDKTAPIAAGDVLGDRYTINGQTYFSGRTKMKLTAVDNKAGVKDIFYSINGSKFQKYNDPFYLPNKAGIHVVRYFATDNVENVSENPEMMSVNYMEYRHRVDRIYMDLLGPVVNYDISGAKYNANDSLFIGPETEISFSAKDSESGLHHISYIIDGKGNEIIYNNKLNISNLEPGAHRIEYFAYDNVNNRNLGAFDVILDKKAPVIEYKFSIVPSGKEGELDIYPSNSKLFLTAQDDMTGIKELYFSINALPEQLYKNYINSFKKGEINTVSVSVKDMLDNKSEITIRFFAK